MEPIFEDTSTAFTLKTDSELERAYFLFKMIANEPLVRIGTAMTNFALKASLPVEGLIRATVFDHFCGGVNENDCLPVVDKMWQKGVCSVLDYSVEGEDTEDPLDETLEKVLHVKTCKKAFDLDVTLLIDAEESWIQDAADELVEQMMLKYNTKKAIVFNTLQLYRVDRLEYLKSLHKRAKVKGFKIGAKVVRGAYMEKENERAKEKGYQTPICSSKKETDLNFDATITYMLNHLEDMSLFAGTHNEESCYKLMQIMQEKNIVNNDSGIWFGQLYGMSDHISFNLAKKGYNVAKYLPFGPVKDVMPYLIRRAEENTSVAGQTTRELSLLKKERKRRKI